MSRLLPHDAYPAEFTGDSAAQDRIDAALRSTLHLVPVEAGQYLDAKNHLWTRHPDGSWEDALGHTKGPQYAPILGTFAPFTKVSDDDHGLSLFAEGHDITDEELERLDASED